MQEISVLITAFILLGASLMTAANAEDIDRTPSPAEVYDLDGNLLDQVTTGHQVVLSKTFVNNRSVREPFVAVFEVRDSSGITVYLAWQSHTMAAEGRVDVDASWVADGVGVYEIRTFPLSNLTNPVVLDVVESRSIPVVEESGA